MAGASILRQLSDEALTELHHKLRRDAETDLAIAGWVEGKLGRPIGPTDSARINVIFRYRRGTEFKRWLKQWENQDASLKATIATQKQRFEYLSSLVQGGGEQGLYAASNHLKARLLTIAAGMSDEDLSSGNLKWLRGLLTEIREAEKLERQGAGKQAEEIAANPKLTTEERTQKIREIFGLV